MRVAFAAVALLLVGCATGYDSHKDVVAPKGSPGSECSGFVSDYFEAAGGGEIVARSDDHARRALFSNMCLSKEDPSKRLTFGVIEFDDEGTHWNRNQFKGVREVIESIGKAQAEHQRRLTEDPSAGPELGSSTSSAPDGVRSEGIFLVAFVHGWRHSAAESSTSLQQFRWFARELAGSDEICNKEPVLDGEGGEGIRRERPCRSRPHVVAVYLAWRGKSTGALSGRLVLPEFLSFWGRKATALRVAGTPMTETLFGMLDALEKADEALARGHAASGTETSGYVPARSRSMIVGHSFGARIVENAFAQALIGSRLESQRASNDRLRSAVASAMEAKNVVEGRELLVEKLHGRLDRRQAEQPVRMAAVETATRTLEEARSKLARLVTQEQADVRFAPYRSPLLGTIDAAHCTEFDSGRVERCVGDAKDVWRSGSCVVDEVACLYRSYACSIQRETARRAKVAPSRSDLSEWCSKAGGSSAETGGKPPEETGERPAGEEDGDNEQNPLVVVGEGDELAEWEAFARALKENHDDLPSAALGDGDGDEIPDWGPARTYLGQVEHWAGSLDLWARIVAVREKALGGVTKDVRERLLEEMDKARAESVDLLSRARDDLEEVKLLEEELGRRGDVRDDVARLDAELEDARSLLRTTEDALAQLPGEIKEAKKAVSSARDGLKSASVVVTRLVDSTLRPPADLILLVNPATEALSARNLIYALCSTEEETMEAISQARGMLTEGSLQILDRRPWIISVTSTGDDATGVYFPRAVQLARFVGGKRNRTFAEEPRGCERDLGSYKDMVVRTAGHSERMVSHEVVMRPGGKGDRNPCETRTPDRGAKGEDPQASEVLFGTGSGAAVVRKASPHPGLADVALGRKYWIVKADPEISRDHNDVFNEHTLGLTTGLICHARLFDSLCPGVDAKSGRCVSGGAAEALPTAGVGRRRLE